MKKPINITLHSDDLIYDEVDIELSQQEQKNTINDIEKEVDNIISNGCNSLYIDYCLLLTILINVYFGNYIFIY